MRIPKAVTDALILTGIITAAAPERPALGVHDPLMLE